MLGFSILTLLYTESGAAVSASTKTFQCHQIPRCGLEHADSWAHLPGFQDNRSEALESAHVNKSPALKNTGAVAKSLGFGVPQLLV